MSTLRPTLRDGKGHEPVMTNGTALFMMIQAVETRPGLIHGKLESNGEYCTVGSYFHINKGTALPSALIDEVAAVNDSMPHVTPRVRKLRMLRWLRWKLRAAGMPGYARAKEA